MLNGPEYETVHGLMKQVVTLRDVARRAGVGVSTVSHALRNEGTISAATRDRVRGIAEEMGYVPSPVLAALAARKFHSDQRLRETPLAYLTFFGKREPINPWTEVHLSGMARQAKVLGYRCESIRLGDRQAARRIGNRLYAAGVAGIALGLADRDADYPWEELGLDRFAVVACGFHPLAGRVHTVRTSVFNPVQRAWKEAHRLGYRRIGAALCRHAKDILDDHIRHAALLEIHEAAGVRQEVPSYFGQHHDYDGYLAWLKRHRPDVVIGFHGGMLHAMLDRGWRVPEEVGFINLHMEEWHVGQFAGVDVRSVEIGRRAVSMLDELIRHKERGLTDDPRTLLVDYIWRGGPTLGEPPRRRGMKAGRVGS